MKAPKHLTREAKRIWRDLIEEYAITDVAGLKVLRVALEAFDRCQKARDTIDGTGLLLKDRFGQPKANPLLAIERDNRAAFLAGIKALNLDIEPLGRPGRK
jgi:P27 family predicted phage terminase small subunit